MADPGEVFPARAERAQTVQERGKGRLLPLRLDRVPELRDEDEVGFAFADDLIRGPATETGVSRGARPVPLVPAHAAAEPGHRFLALGPLERSDARDPRRRRERSVP